MIVVIFKHLLIDLDDLRDCNSQFYIILQVICHQAVIWTSPNRWHKIGYLYLSLWTTVNYSIWKSKYVVSAFMHTRALTVIAFPKCYKTYFKLHLQTLNSEACYFTNFICFKEGNNGCLLSLQKWFHHINKIPMFFGVNRYRIYTMLDVMLFSILLFDKKYAQGLVIEQ